MKNFEETPEKKVKKAAEKAKEAVEAAEKAVEEAKKALKAVEELSDEELSEVAGAGDPFGGIPRIEPEPIDDDLRKDG